MKNKISFGSIKVDMSCKFFGLVVCYLLEFG